MDSATVALIIRHVLTAAGGILVTKGILDSGQVETIIGAVLPLISVGWAVVQKWQAHAAVKNAAATGNPVQPTLTSSTKAAAP